MSVQSMQISIEQLREAIDLLLLKIKESKGDIIEIENDYYWVIDEAELYDPYSEPKEMGLGQLSDDIMELKKLLKSPDDSIIFYHLKIVSEILKALSIESDVV